MPKDLVILLEDIPLSGDDLLEISEKMGNPDVGWVLYDDLQKINDLDELPKIARAKLEREGDTLNTVFVLLQIKHTDGIQSVGHWVTLSKSGDTIIYYDPYGLSISQDLIVTGEPDLLSRLLKGKKVDVNSFKHQNIKHETNVCGRHCCLRSIFHFLSNKDYNDDIIRPMIDNKEVKDSDVMISLITGLLSKSDEIVKKILTERITPTLTDETRITRVRDSFRGLGGSVLG